MALSDLVWCSGWPRRGRPVISFSYHTPLDAVPRMFFWSCCRLCSSKTGSPAGRTHPASGVFLSAFRRKRCLLCGVQRQGNLWPRCCSKQKAMTMEQCGGHCVRHIHSEIVDTGPTKSGLTRFIGSGRSASMPPDSQRLTTDKGRCSSDHCATSLRVA